MIQLTFWEVQGVNWRLEKDHLEYKYLESNRPGSYKFKIVQRTVPVKIHNLYVPYSAYWIFVPTSKLPVLSISSIIWKVFLVNEWNNQSRLVCVHTA